MVTTPDIFVWAAGRMKNAKFFQTMLFLHSSGYFDLLPASLVFCHYRHWSKSYQFLICCWCRRNTEIAVIQFSDFGWLYLCAKLFFLLQIFCGVFLNLSESDTRKKYLEYFWFWKKRLKCLLVVVLRAPFHYPAILLRVHNHRALMIFFSLTPCAARRLRRPCPVSYHLPAQLPVLVVVLRAPCHHPAILLWPRVLLASFTLMWTPWLEASRQQSFSHWRRRLRLVLSCATLS